MMPRKLGLGYKMAGWDLKSPRLVIKSNRSTADQLQSLGQVTPPLKTSLFSFPKWQLKMKADKKHDANTMPGANTCLFCQVSLVPLVNMHISLIIFFFKNFSSLTLPSDEDLHTLAWHSWPFTVCLSHLSTTSLHLRAKPNQTFVPSLGLRHSLSSWSALCPPLKSKSNLNPI